MQRKGTPYNGPKSGWHQGVYDPGAFKLDHLESTKAIFARWISTFLTGHMQQFPFLHAEERDTLQWTQKWTTPRVVWPWGIRIGSFGVYKTYFCKMNFHFFNRPHASVPFSCMQRKGHPTMDPKKDDPKGYMSPGHSNWTICSPQNLFLQDEYPLF